jgi:hypothetical protein
MINKKKATAAFGLMLITGGFAIAGPDDPDRSFPQSVNPSSAERVEVRDASNRVVLTGSFEAPRADSDDANTTERHARLVGETVGVRGTAEIEVSTRSGAARREMSIDVDALAPATQYRILVDGVEVATVTTDAEGEASIDFDDTPGR